MKKKVLVVGISGIYGGLEKIVLSIVEQCSHVNFEFLCFGQETLGRKEMLNERKVYYVTANRKNPWKSICEQKKFWIENGKKYDVVWINTCSASNISFHKFAKKYSNAKIVTHSHSSRIEHDSALLRLFHYIRHYANRRKLVSLSDVLLTCSSQAGKHLYGHQRESIMINNGVDIEQYKYNPANRMRIRDEYAVEDDEVLILMVGRLVEVKNPMYGLLILDNLLKRNKKAKLLFVGDGDLKESLIDEAGKRNIQEHLLFAGFQKNVEWYLSAGDCFILPSLFEGLPLSVIEAQAANLPCIVSNRVTHEVKVSGLVNYLPITENDVNEWTNMIENLNYFDRNHYEGNSKILKFDLKFVKKQFLDALELHDDT